MAEDSKRERVVILRIGHRVQRDARVTTHVCLTARALGADAVIISDVSDKRIVETVNRVTANFGGNFKVDTAKSWRSAIADWKRSGGTVVHLTAYGMPLPKIIESIQGSRKDKLVIVGAEKVPGELYRLADWNVAVTNQPISEVSALGIFLDWYFDHSRLEERFPGAKLEIIPREHGKKVVTA